MRRKFQRLTDCFALLHEQRRPWVDPDSLKQRFHDLAARYHPDRIHSASDSEKAAANQRYAELNAAYQCLRDPKERLAHLLQLESGSLPSHVHQVPPATADLFIEISQLCRTVDAFLAEKRKQSSPLLQVQYFEKTMEWTEQLVTMQRALEGQRAELENRLKALNPIWDQAPPTGNSQRQALLPLGLIEEIYRMLSYLGRWSAQIQERIGQLAF